MTEQELKIQQQFEQKGMAEYVADTDAMRPLIRPGKDVCLIRPLPRHGLSVGDIILYRRSDDALTLGRITVEHHRVARYRACGDNRSHEVHGIARASIVGLLYGIKRNGDFCYYTSDFQLRLYNRLMRLRTALVLGYRKNIEKPLLKAKDGLTKPFRKNKYGVTVEGINHSNHHHHSHSDFRVSHNVWSDITHAIDNIMPDGGVTLGQQAPEVKSRRSWKSILMFWKKEDHHHHHHHYDSQAQPSQHHHHDSHGEHHHHHQHTSYDEIMRQEHGALQIHHGQYFLLGFRVPWVPKFLLKKYGLRKVKAVNNNIITQMDWTIHSNEFKMPYNMSMQTLSMGVFVVLVAKLALAVWWLAFFLIFGNENSSRIYMYNLLFTATWFPIALFFLAYFFHLNKILFMSIQRITLMAAVVSLLRVALFVFKLAHSDTALLSLNLVTLFNAMEVVCWLCLSGFFFIMHYKLSGRKDFIPHFWETGSMTEERQRKKALKNLEKARRREAKFEEENHEQHYHVEH